MVMLSNAETAKMGRVANALAAVRGHSGQEAEEFQQPAAPALGSWDYWVARYLDLRSQLLESARSGDVAHGISIGSQINALIAAASRNGFASLAADRFAGGPPAWTPEAIEAWARNSEIRLQQGIGAAPRPAINWQHSSVRLVKEWEGNPVGAEMIGPPEDCLRLVRERVAVWVDTNNVPKDSAAPKPRREPEGFMRGYVPVRFVRDGFEERRGINRGGVCHAGQTGHLHPDDATRAIGAGYAVFAGPEPVCANGVHLVPPGWAEPALNAERKAPA